MQLLVHLLAKGALREHALNCLLNHLLRLLRHHLAKRSLLHAADIEGVGVVNLLLHLLAAHRNLVCIDDNDIVAAVNMRGENRLVLASQHCSNLRSETSEGGSIRIDHIPFSLNGIRIRHKTLHDYPPSGHGSKDPCLLPDYT